LLLFLDQLIIAIGNWIYWLLISRLTSTAQIGDATTIYSLIVLASTLCEVGLEYPLLKKSSTHPSQILGSALIIELVLVAAAVLIVIYFITYIYEERLHGFAWLAGAILIALPLGFVSSFLLLGRLEAKWIIMIDTIGICVKFSFGYVLVVIGLGASGLLISFLIHAVFIAGVTLTLAKRKVGLKLPELRFIRETFMDGLSNMPSKLSRMFIFSLSVVLLASFGISSSDIGIFYIALMISIVVGGLFSSIAYMIIPASSMSERDLSFDSIRISISLTALIVAALVVSPKTVLLLIGKEYVQAEAILLVLSIGILPFSIVENAISKFNYLGKSRTLLFIGLIQLLSFLVSFLFLVPYFGTLGAAFSIIIGLIASAIVSIFWLERALIRYIVNSEISIALGWAAGYIFLLISGGALIDQIAAMVSSMVIALISIIALKNTSISEIKHLIKTMVSSTDSQN
jgi:O-antigen/teichoic acid export membrane protein